MTIIEKIEKLIAVWRMRNLTLAGKITILKSLVLSKIVFITYLSYTPKIIVEAVRYTSIFYGEVKELRSSIEP